MDISDIRGNEPARQKILDDEPGPDIRTDADAIAAGEIPTHSAA